MRKRLTDKTIFLVVVVLCIALFLVFYNFVFVRINDSIDAIKVENAGIMNHLAELQEYYDTKAQNLENIEIMSKEVTNILAKFPADVRNEDMIGEGVTIYRTVNTDGALKMLYTGIEMSDAEEVYVVNQAVIDGAKVEGYTKPINFMQRKTVYSSELGYFTLKDAVKEILSSDYALNLDIIDFKVNEETGLLSGYVQLQFFYVTGTDKEYVAPKVDSYDKNEESYNNLFINSTIVVEEEEEE